MDFEVSHGFEKIGCMVDEALSIAEGLCYLYIGMYHLLVMPDLIRHLVKKIKS